MPRNYPIRDDYTVSRAIVPAGYSDLYYPLLGDCGEESSSPFFWTLSDLGEIILYTGL